MHPQKLFLGIKVANSDRSVAFPCDNSVRVLSHRHPPFESCTSRFPLSTGACIVQWTRQIAHKTSWPAQQLDSSKPAHREFLVLAAPRLVGLGGREVSCEATTECEGVRLKRCCRINMPSGHVASVVRMASVAPRACRFLCGAQRTCLLGCTSASIGGSADRMAFRHRSASGQEP